MAGLIVSVSIKDMDIFVQALELIRLQNKALNAGTDVEVNALSGEAAMAYRKFSEQIDE